MIFPSQHTEKLTIPTSDGPLLIHQSLESGGYSVDFDETESCLQFHDLIVPLCDK